MIIIYNSHKIFYAKRIGGYFMYDTLDRYTDAAVVSNTNLSYLFKLRTK